MSRIINTSVWASRYDGAQFGGHSAGLHRSIPPPEARFLREAIRVSFLPGSALGMTESFGERLRRLRIERGLTVVDLASAVGVAEGTIRQIETGNVKSPNFHLGLRLATHLNVDPQYLAVGEGISVTDRFEAIETRLAKLERRVASLPQSRR